MKKYYSALLFYFFVSGLMCQESNVKPSLLIGQPIPYYQKVFLDTFKIIKKVDSVIQKESYKFWPKYNVNLYLNVTFKLKAFNLIQISKVETNISIAKADDYYSNKTFSFTDTIKQSNQFNINSLLLNLEEHTIVYENADKKSKILIQREETDRIFNLELLEEKPITKASIEYIKIKFLYNGNEGNSLTQEIEGWIPYNNLVIGFW